ncbi:hypothetical protein Leryth_016393 [Lithospermum erythrorhizon]|nr:hypothetical protein Leryth_016393 [Lithospermum erythrorhizon]
MYSRFGNLRDAIKVFDEMPLRDTVSWNSIVSGFLRCGWGDIGFGYFEMMLGGACGVDHASFTTILSVCDGVERVRVSEMIHGLAVLSGYDGEVSVGNALVTAYFRCRSVDSGRRKFDEMIERNVISWTAVISGLEENEWYEDSLKMFVEMCSGYVVPNHLTFLAALLSCSGFQALKEGRQIHGMVWKSGMQSDVCIESALMDMYSKCGSADEAWQIFECAEFIDEISMTVILASFAQNGLGEEAIRIFVKIVKAGMQIDPSMISAVLGVFDVETSLGLGKQVHALATKKGVESNIFISNGLISMYSKCGELEDSVRIFHMMPLRNSISWNSIISAFARHGNGFKALQLYDEMRSEHVEPTDVTFLSLLQACSHVGLVDKGMEFLESMQNVYGFKPRIEHHACVVDMLGRAGRLNDAKKFIMDLPVKPDPQVWQTLLGACCLHGDTVIGKYAADALQLSSPNSAVSYIAMANIYSSRGRWKERASTIKQMKEARVRKVTGISWIEIGKQVHSFVVADQMHPLGDGIYNALLKLLRHMKDEGYVPDKKFVLSYMDQDQQVSVNELEDPIFMKNA